MFVVALGDRVRVFDFVNTPSEGAHRYEGGYGWWVCACPPGTRCQPKKGEGGLGLFCWRCLTGRARKTHINAATFITVGLLRGSATVFLAGVKRGEVCFGG